MPRAKYGRMARDVVQLRTQLAVAQEAEDSPRIAEIRRALSVRVERLAAAHRCEVCGRSLSDPTSVALGVGPECAGK